MEQWVTTHAPVYDTEKTVETMVNENTLTDKNFHTVEMYVEGCLNPAIDKYWELDKIGHLSYQDL